MNNKPRVRLHHVGQATFRLVTRDRGYGGPYGQYRQPAKWACIECHAIVRGTDERPEVFNRWNGEPDQLCARNGHAPCRECGQMLPRLNDGCPREHRWQVCPGKTEADRMIPQHAHKGHLARSAS
jgi:hypothetical protein